MKQKIGNTIKAVLSTILVMVLMLGMGVPALAAGEGSITISNATVGHDYKAYKVFDAQYVKTGAVYLIQESDPWYDLVSGEDSPFDLAEDPNNSGTYYVTAKANADVIGWFKGLTADRIPTADTASQKATNTTVKFTDFDEGYYFITSSLGALVTVTNADPHVEVVDKNQKPGWETPEDPNQGKGKNVSADGTDYYQNVTAGINDTVYFKINAFVPKYNEDKAVYQYTFTDTLGDGFTLDFNSISATIAGFDAFNPAITEDTDNPNKFTVTFNVHGVENYPTDASIEITYQATVNKDAVHDNTNKAEMDWTEFDPGTPEDPKYPSTNPSDPNYPAPPTDLPTDVETNTYVFGFNLQKYAGSVLEENKLDGAAFRLYDAETDGAEIPVVAVDGAAGTYRVAVEGETGVDIKAGTAKIFGLDAGTYYLEEVKTPAGYNPLTERVEVIIAKDANGDFPVDADGYLTSEVQVINETGTTLPGTGGIGTTIFYIVGGSLILGVVIVLVNRRRARD